MRRGYDVDWDIVLEEAQLFEPLGELERSWCEGVKAVKCGAAVGVEAEVFPDRWVNAVAVIRDGGSGKVEGAVLRGADDLDGVWIGQVFGGAEGFERCDLDCGIREGCEQGGDVFRAQERLVALDVDVDICWMSLRNGVDAIGAGGEIGAGENRRPIVGDAQGEDFVGVSGDEDLVKLRAGTGGVIDPAEHRTSSDLAQNLAGQAGGGQASRDDPESAGPGSTFDLGESPHDHIDQGNGGVDECRPVGRCK